LKKASLVKSALLGVALYILGGCTGPSEPVVIRAGAQLYYRDNTIDTLYFIEYKIMGSDQMVRVEDGLEKKAKDLILELHTGDTITIKRSKAVHAFDDTFIIKADYITPRYQDKKD
jgi:hypothetical protein